MDTADTAFKIVMAQKDDNHTEMTSFGKILVWAYCVVAMALVHYSL